MGRIAAGIDLGITKAWVGISVVEQIERMCYVRVLDAVIPPRGGKVDLVNLEEDIFALADKFNCPVYFDPYQSLSMQQRLIRRGVRCIEFPFTMESRRRLFGRLLDLIEDGRIKVRPHPELKKQLLALIAKRLPSGGWRIDHRPNQKDDLVVAIALALEGLPDVGSELHKPEGVGRRTAYLGAEGAIDELIPWTSRGTQGVPPKLWGDW